MRRCKGVGETLCRILTPYPKFHRERRMKKQSRARCAGPMCLKHPSKPHAVYPTVAIAWSKQGQRRSGPGTTTSFPCGWPTSCCTRREGSVPCGPTTTTTCHTSSVPQPHRNPANYFWSLLGASSRLGDAAFSVSADVLSVLSFGLAAGGAFSGPFPGAGSPPITRTSRASSGSPD